MFYKEKMKYSVGGLSIRGSYHTVNQDYFLVRQFEFGSVLVLSDGLGSKSMSQYGSRALCECAVCLAEESHCQIENPDSFLKCLHREWLIALDGHPVDECYCTALIVIIGKEQLYVFHLGDGIVAIKIDNGYVISIEEKDDDFSNYTYPLTEELDLDDWVIFNKPFHELQGVYLSSDGVELSSGSEEVIENFLDDFIEGYEFLESQEIEKDIESWLVDWPSADDKTIAFLLRGEKLNE